MVAILHVVWLPLSRHSGDGLGRAQFEGVRVRHESKTISRVRRSGLLLRPPCSSAWGDEGEGIASDNSKILSGAIGMGSGCSSCRSHGRKMSSLASVDME